MTTPSPDRYTPSDQTVIEVGGIIERAVAEIRKWRTRSTRDLAYAAALQVLSNAMAEELAEGHLAEFRAGPSVDTKRAHLRNVHGLDRESVRYLQHPALNRVHDQITRQADQADPPEEPERDCVICVPGQCPGPECPGSLR
jgi:hypothetical protein